MRRALLSLVILAALGLGTSSALARPHRAAAGHVPHLVSGPVGILQRDRNVEQLPGVWNPTACLWDPDDQDQSIGSGWLGGGESATISGCIIGGPNVIDGISWAIHPRLRFDVSSDRAVGVSVVYTPGVTVALTGPTCIDGPMYAQDSPALVPIPDSEGGTGVPTTYGLVIANPGSHKATVAVSLSGGNDQDGCPGVTPVPIEGQPFALSVQ